MAFPTATLADYLTALRRLVHDPSDRYWSAADKTAYINQAIQQRDQDTGANRSIITINLVANDDTYTLSDLSNTRVFDVVGINLIVGSTRVVLNQRSYTQLCAEYRPLTSAQSMPKAWCKYNPTTIIFGPKPGVVYSTEWDCSIISAELSADADADVLTGKFTTPVPFLAAYLCKINERRPDEAGIFLAEYYRWIQACQGARAGLLPTAYPSAR